MAARSATFRLTLAIAAVAALVGTAALAGGYALVARHLDDRLHAAVAADLAGLADLYAQRRIVALREAIARRAEEGAEGAYLLLDKSGAPLAGTLPSWPEGVRADGGWTAFDVADAPHLGAAATLPGGFALLVAHPTAENDRMLASLRGGMGVAALMILAAGAGLGWLVSRRVLAGIDRVNAVVARVEAGDLAARAPGAEAPDEFGELAANVNRMLDRIGRLVAGMREVSDRIAHELRTPLNRIRGRVDRLRRDPATPPATADGLAGIAGEIDRTVAIFEALLDIASAEADAGDRSLLGPVDLRAVADDVVELYGAVAEDKAVTLEADLAPEAVVLGDRNLLTRMLANVVDNAVKFSPEGGRVTVRLAASAGTVELAVRDTGPGIEPGTEERLFERFARGDRTGAAPGHGLGLPLVRAIAVRHGLGIRLANVDGGLEVRFAGAAFRPGGA
jgi:signal transduction histidine kinase